MESMMLKFLKTYVMRMLLLTNIMLMNLCLVIVSLIPPFLPIPRHLPKIQSYPTFFHQTKVLILIMNSPIVILKGYLLKKPKLIYSWLKTHFTLLRLNILNLHVALCLLCPLQLVLHYPFKILSFKPHILPCP